MTSDDISSSFQRVAGACEVHWRMEARATAVDHQILKPSRSVDEEAVMATRVHEHDLEVRNLRRRVGDFPETYVARGGVWHGFE